MAMEVALAGLAWIIACGFLGYGVGEVLRRTILRRYPDIEKPLDL